MKRVISILLSLVTILPAAARIVLCDENCKVEFTSAVENEPRFAVVSPVGMPTVEKITQAPRLTTLDGKTIAIVGESFMTEIIHPEIARLIAKHYPTAKVVTVQQVGMAGVYPAPGVRRRGKEEFQAKLKEYGVDAVITGNCGCGLYTQKECGSAIAAPTFIEQVYYTATNNGIAAPRVAEYPGAFVLHTTEELLTNTRDILWDRIISALTTPTTDAELNLHKADTSRGTINQWQWHITNSETSQLTPPPVWHATSDSKIATIPTMKQGMTAILITGDESRNKVQIMPGGGFVSRAVR